MPQMLFPTAGVAATASAGPPSTVALAAQMPPGIVRAASTHGGAWDPDPPHHAWWTPLCSFGLAQSRPIAALVRCCAPASLLREWCTALHRCAAAPPAGPVRCLGPPSRTPEGLHAAMPVAPPRTLHLGAAGACPYCSTACSREYPGSSTHSKRSSSQSRHQVPP